MLHADLVVRMQSACAAGIILVFYLAFISDFCENELFWRIKQKLISPYCLEEGMGGYSHIWPNGDVPL